MKAAVDPYSQIAEGVAAGIATGDWFAVLIEPDTGEPDVVQTGMQCLQSAQNGEL